MRSTGEELRARIVAAAREEFAAHGLAGARIDRIAAAARASKERLYAHFGDKATLFRFILDTDSEEFFAPLVAQPDDLPGFVGAMFDRSRDHVEHLRMFTWARMSDEPFDLVHANATVAHLREVVAEGQRLGFVDPAWDPLDVVSLMFIHAFAWLQTPAPDSGLYGRNDPARERRTAVDAIRRLTAVPS
jgi:AcrR family transcriptional regulator